MEQKQFKELEKLAKGGYSYPDMAVEANVSQKQNPSPSFKNTKKMMANAFRGSTKPAPLPKSAAAAPSFDMEAFNKENPVIEGKEFDPIPQARRKLATSKKVADADSQANKMKSVKKGSFSIFSPHEEMRAKREQRARTSFLDPSKMSFADAAVHLNSGKFRNHGFEPKARAMQKEDSNTKRAFHNHFRNTAKNNSPMPLPKSFVIPTDKMNKGAVHNPAALAAYIGRKKYGNEKYAEMSAAGKHHKKKTDKPGGGKRFKKLEHKLEEKSVRAGKLRKSDIGYIEKHYSGKFCGKCHEPLTEDNTDIHSATYGERHKGHPLCVACVSKIRN